MIAESQHYILEKTFLAYGNMPNLYIDISNFKKEIKKET
jgi:hypothetical protein